MAETKYEESWLWSKAWQAKEKRAEEDLKTGRYQDFNNIDDLIAYLNNSVSDG